MSQEVTGSSEYSSVSDAEPDVQAENMPVEVKTETRAEDLLLAQAAQALTARSPVDDVVDSVFWTVLTSSKSDFGDGGASTDHEHQQRSDTVP
jgi:hypothetical protein